MRGDEVDFEVWEEDGRYGRRAGVADGAPYGGRDFLGVARANARRAAFLQRAFGDGAADVAHLDKLFEPANIAGKRDLPALAASIDGDLRRDAHVSRM